MKVAVIGAGSWGTAVAALVAANAPTTLWARRPELAAHIDARAREHRLPPGDRAPGIAAWRPPDLETACTDADVVVVGVPSHGFRAVLAEARPYIAPDARVISLSKGVEQGTLRRMTEVVAEELDGHDPSRIGVLTGPNLAKEVAAGQPTASVVATTDAAVAEELQQLFLGPTFRVYTNPDVVGCEIAGTLKNVLAIGAGIARRARVRRQHQGRADHARARRARAARRRARRRSADVRRPRRHGRPHRDVQQPAEPQPPCRRRAREGPCARRDRDRDEHGGRGREEHRRGDRARAAPRRSRCRSRRSSAACCTKARVRPTSCRSSCCARRSPSSTACDNRADAAKPRTPKALSAQRGSHVTADVLGVLGAPVRRRSTMRASSRPSRHARVVGRCRRRLARPRRRHDRRVRGGPGVAPSYETAVRVPSGDFVQRAYGVATPSGAGAIAVDFENASRAPCSVALFLARRHAGPRRGSTATCCVSTAHPLLTLARPPRLWAAGPDARVTVGPGGPARSEPADWSASHRGRAPRAGAAHDDAAHRVGDRAARHLGRCPIRKPSSAAGSASSIAARGPSCRNRGPRRSTRRAPTCLLRDPTPDVVAALEDWGFDAEATRGWPRLGWRARRAARRRAPVDGWTAVRALDPERDTGRCSCSRCGRCSSSKPRDHVDLLPHFPPEWLGQNIAVHDLPLRGGLLSFAVRWHGARPALLWDAPAGIELRAPALDPQWRGTRRRRDTARRAARTVARDGIAAPRRCADRRSGIVRGKPWTSRTSSTPGSTTRTSDDADVRLAVLRFLTDEVGASIPEIVQARRGGPPAQHGRAAARSGPKAPGRRSRRSPNAPG